MSSHPQFLIPVLTVLGLAVACSGSKGTHTPSPIPEQASTVIAGGFIAGASGSVNYPCRALYWRDGKAVNLPDDGSSFGAYVTGMQVSGEDIYAVGNGSGVGITWKNGVASIITDPTTRTDYANVNLMGIAVSGNDVYVVGNSADNSPYSTAAYWKNGVPVLLGTGYSTASAICVQGSDVYVAGNEGGARYWKNGVPMGLGSATGDAYTYAIAVTSKGDVLVAGLVYVNNIGVATLWRNGIPTSLSDGIHGAKATALAISGTNVYVAGVAYDGKTNIATLWKNGVATTISESGLWADVNGICLDGRDVYIAGDLNDNATYWKNGTASQLYQGADTSVLTAICVLRQ